ncbi:MAG TPA: alpha/beta fold hydrolase [Casimicrobiaceae bacterium]|jgi:pimeloyl-ACP methyl ester carboxylesterase
MNFDVGGEQVYAYTGSRAFDASLPTIVFVHGAAGDHSVWALQSRYFAHHGHNVLALDLPGHGRSGGSARRSVPALADWLVTVLDALGIERAVLAGHSLGSLVVLDVAGRHPQRTSHLALLATSVPMRVSDALLSAAASDEAFAYAMITQWSFSDAHQLGGNQQPGMWMIGTGLRLMERCSPGVLHADLSACNEYGDGLDRAASLSLPALLILGERDQMAPLRNARALASALRHVCEVHLPGCGHSLMTEAPDAVLDALRDFLAAEHVAAAPKVAARAR